jgi:hypothetical protein
LDTISRAEENNAVTVDDMLEGTGRLFAELGSKSILVAPLIELVVLSEGEIAGMLSLIFDTFTLLSVFDVGRV